VHLMEQHCHVCLLKIKVGDTGGICRGKSCAIYGASQIRLRHVTVPQSAVGGHMSQVLLMSQVG
jgi:hypothetical protein